MLGVVPEVVAVAVEEARGQGEQVPGTSWQRVAAQGMMEGTWMARTLGVFDRNVKRCIGQACVGGT
jgi:hypothetical protein